MPTYTTTIREDYQLEIWDNCSAELQIGPNRARIIADICVWRNNTGTRKTVTRYISLEDAAKVTAAYNAAVKEFESDDPHGHIPREVLIEGLASNYSPHDIPVSYTRR